MSVTLKRIDGGVLFVADLVAQGVEFIREPIDREWGLRTSRTLMATSGRYASRWPRIRTRDKRADTSSRSWGVPTVHDPCGHKLSCLFGQRPPLLSERGL